MTAKAIKSQARVVVIGGGIAGCSTLYHLTREGGGAGPRRPAGLSRHHRRLVRHLQGQRAGHPPHAGGRRRLPAQRRGGDEGRLDQSQRRHRPLSRRAWPLRHPLLHAVAPRSGAARLRRADLEAERDRRHRRSRRRAFRRASRQPLRFLPKLTSASLQVAAAAAGVCRPLNRAPPAAAAR